MNKKRQVLLICYLSEIAGISFTVQQSRGRRRYIQGIQPPQVLQRCAILSMKKEQDT
jgi:hypothetical protein